MARSPHTIFFCDIDGVLLPGRAYYMAGQTWPLQTKFDPCAVGMLNRLCKELDGKVVIHSNWRGTEERRLAKHMRGLQDHFVEQGVLAEYMHGDPLCPSSTRRDRWTDICARVPVAVFDRGTYAFPALNGKAARRYAARQVPALAAATLPNLKPPAWVYFHTRRHPASASNIRARRRSARTRA